MKNNSVFRLTIIKFKVLEEFNEYANTNSSRNICSFIGCFVSNDEFSTEGPSTGEQSQEQIDVPLNFSLKVKGGGEDNNASSTQGGKDVSVNLKIQVVKAETPYNYH